MIHMTRKRNNERGVDPMAPAPPASRRESSPATRTNLATRHKYKNSRRRQSWMPLIIVVCGVAAIVAVVQFSRPELTQQRIGVHPEPGDTPIDIDQPAASRPVVSADTVRSEDANTTGTELANGNHVNDLTGGSSENGHRLAQSKPTPVAKMSSLQRRQFGELLLRARNDIESKRFEHVEKGLTEASSFPADSGDLGKIERLRILSDYVEEFWAAFDESLADLEGVELDVDGKQALVVSVSEDQIVFRQLGENVRYSTEALPAEFVLAIADRRFAAEAASSSVFRGAFMAVEPRFGKERARQLWQSASAAGIDIGDLELVLDDSY